jgi:hypothetical protein
MHETATYLKHQLHASPALQTLDEDTVYAMVEALMLVLRLGRHHGGVPAIDFRVLSQGKPGQRIAGPWSGWADLNEWAALAMRENIAATPGFRSERVPRNWRERVGEIAPRVPAAAIPVLARVMGYAAAFDDLRRGDPRDVGALRDVVRALGGASRSHDELDRWLAEGIDARSRTFDYGFAVARMLELSLELPSSADDQACAEAWNGWADRLAAVTLKLPDGRTEPEALVGRERASVLIAFHDYTSSVVIRRFVEATRDQATCAALERLHGMSHVFADGDDANQAAWQVVENTTALAQVELASGGTLDANAARIFEPPVTRCWVLQHLVE